jgi:uncharacterized membrane protein
MLATRQGLRIETYFNRSFGGAATRALRIATIAALAFLALTAIVGAIPMLMRPAGEPWSMPQNLLRHSPFHSYLIPGIILLVANGLLSLWVLWLTLRKQPNYGLWVGAQGCVLFGWLIVEVAMLRVAVWPHYLYGTVALVLVVAGIAWVRLSRPLR